MSVKVEPGRFSRIVRRLREEHSMILNARCAESSCRYCCGRIVAILPPRRNYYVVPGVINRETRSSKRFPFFQCERCGTYFDLRGNAISLRAGPKGLFVKE